MTDEALLDHFKTLSSTIKAILEFNKEVSKRIQALEKQLEVVERKLNH